VFGLSLKAMALMYLRLINPPKSFDDSTRAACQRIVEAMLKYPELIGGTKDRLDTAVMRAARGVLSKVGAEGVCTLAVLPCQQWPGGLALAVKIEDGDDHRARPTVVIEALRQLGVLSNDALDALRPYSSFAISNRRDEKVGEVRARFDLNGSNSR
jgi:L-asparaginase II